MNAKQVPPPVPERRPMPPAPLDAGTGLVCSCGEVWWEALVAMGPDYSVNIVVSPVCGSCGQPAPPQVTRDWHHPRVQ